ncbi:hypothetical protein IM538_07440 [Cytobacillus suaedae]|nr:hypothetical protein IM538_07440 [Cytobacillus suaedae]
MPNHDRKEAKVGLNNDFDGQSVQRGLQNDNAYNDSGLENLDNKKRTESTKNEK